MCVWEGGGCIRGVCFGCVRGGVCVCKVYVWGVFWLRSGGVCVQGVCVGRALTAFEGCVCARCVCSLPLRGFQKLADLEAPSDCLHCQTRAQLQTMEFNRQALGIVRDRTLLFKDYKLHDVIRRRHVIWLVPTGPYSSSSFFRASLPGPQRESSLFDVI